MGLGRGPDGDLDGLAQSGEKVHEDSPVRFFALILKMSEIKASYPENQPQPQRRRTGVSALHDSICGVDLSATTFRKARDVGHPLDEASGKGGEIAEILRRQALALRGLAHPQDDSAVGPRVARACASSG